jgi:hypothetical protein
LKGQILGQRVSNLLGKLADTNGRTDVEDYVSPLWLGFVGF